MGADTFFTYGPGGGVDSAFVDAVRAARHENGHGGYTGTLAEKRDYTVIDRTPRWLDDAQDYAERLVEADDWRVSDKWGPAGAIAVCLPTTTRYVTLPGSSYPAESDWKTLAAGELPRGTLVAAARPVRYERLGGGRMGSVQLEVTVRRRGAGVVEAREVTVTVAGGRHERDFTQRVEQAVRAKLRLGDDAVMSSLRMSQFSAVSAATKTRGTGRATRWVITGDRSHDTWERGFVTVTEARRRLAELAKAPLGQWDTERRYELQGVTRAGDGGPVAAVAVAARRTTVTVTVDVTRGRQQPTTTDGWLFFGLASS